MEKGSEWLAGSNDLEEIVKQCVAAIEGGESSLLADAQARVRDTLV